MFQTVQKYSPTLGHCFLVLAVLFAAQLVMGVFSDMLPQSIVYAVSMIFPIGLVFLLAQKSPQADIRPLNSAGQGVKACLIVAALAVPLTLCIIYLIDPLPSLIPMPEVFKMVLRRVFYGCTPADLIISTCVLAPLAEEFLCRGVMARGLAGRMSRQGAILWSAALFAIMHANPWQAIPAFILGYFFGWIYLRTGCIWISIGLHSLNNLISSISALSMPELELDSGLADIMGGTYWHLFPVVLLVAVLFVCSILYVFHKYEKTVSS